METAQKRVAVAIDFQGRLSAHFGRAFGYLVYTIENGTVISRELRPVSFPRPEGECGHEHAGTHSHEPIIRLLSDSQVVICRGMGQRALVDLRAAGVDVCTAPTVFEPEEAIRLWLAGRLSTTEESDCGCHPQQIERPAH